MKKGLKSNRWCRQEGIPDGAGERNSDGVEKFRLKLELQSNYLMRT